MKAVGWSLAVLLVLAVGCADEGGVERVGDGSEVSGPTQLSEGPTARIVGGTSFSGLEAAGALTYDGGAHCTGTLIEPTKVVTAAHCLDGFSASRMKFVTGANIDSPNTTTQVASIKVHPSYDDYNIRNDIGIVTLVAQPNGVEPMPIVTDMDSSWVGTDLFFVGYGASNGYQQTGYGTKRAVWMGISEVNSTTFRYNDYGKNTCNGDSGGPAFYRDDEGNYYVAGVTSYGDQYCVEYGVDTRIDAFLDFIDLQVEETPVETDGCQGETWEGRCDGEVLYWCQDNSVKVFDCESADLVCGADPSGFNCIEPEEVDPCGGETYEGRCEGNVVVWCDNEEVHTQTCGSNEACTYDTSASYYACREVEEDPCQGETYEGRCSGDTVIWCENEEVKSVDCDDRGLSCGYSSSASYYGCVY